MKNTNSIEVVPYDPNWPEMFEAEAAAIKNVLGDNCIAIYHIGSTAVPGLSAKPVIDIIPVVRNIDQVDAVNSKLQTLGYEAMGEYGMLFRRFFKKENAHVHVYQEGNAEIEHHLKFRDWMRVHPEDRDAYMALKISLAKKYSNNRLDYLLGKDEFITSIDNKTGFNGLRIVNALTPKQWDTVKYFRQKYFFGPHQIEDPYTWTFNHVNHQHLVLFLGAEIIGYAHIQFWPNQRAAMRIIVIDEVKRNKHFGSKFLQLCEIWLKSQGYKSIHVESSPTALAFYKKNDYLEMPFNDPDGYESSPEDTEVGKQL